MKEKGICVSVGKCVGSTYQATVGTTTRVAFFFSNVVRTVADETTGICSRIGNLFKRVKGDSRLAHWEVKRKDDFAELGGEIYKLKGKNLESILEEEKVKKILEKVEEDQSEIQKIKDAITDQHKKMQRMVVYKHSMRQLQNPEPNVRRAALRVLERLNDRRAVPEVVALLSDPDAGVRAQARQVIHKIAGPKEKEIETETPLEKEGETV